VTSAKNFLPILAATLLAMPYLEPRVFPLAWIAFVPLFCALSRAKSWRRAIFYGWLTGFAAHLIGFHWLAHTISAFGGFPFWLSVIVFLLYAALQAIQMALFAMFLHGSGFGPLLIFPAVFWVSLEFLFPLLFPWHLANSQVSFAWLIQSADLVGPYGASFIVMWFNAAVYRAAVERPQVSSSRVLTLAY
jgi:apolipoprotein N-acyltransferase